MKKTVTCTLLLLTLICCSCGRKKQSVEVVETGEKKYAENTVSVANVSENEDQSIAEITNANRFIGTWKDIYGQLASLSVSTANGEIYDIEIDWSERHNHNTHWVFTGTYDAESDLISYVGAKIEQDIQENGLINEEVISSGVTGILWFDEDDFLRWENDYELKGNDCVFANIESDYFYDNSVIEAIPGVVTDISVGIMDGLYPVSFSKEDIVSEDGNKKIWVTFYNYDCYEVEDVKRIREGSIIRIQNQEAEVSEVQWIDNEERLDINGGYGVEGISLCLEDSGYYYRTCVTQDFPDYYPIGLALLPIDGRAGLDESDEEWQPLDTLIEIQAGVIVKLTKEQVPTIIE